MLLRNECAINDFVKITKEQFCHIAAKINNIHKHKGATDEDCKIGICYKYLKDENEKTWCLCIPHTIIDYEEIGKKKWEGKMWVSGQMNMNMDILKEKLPKEIYNEVIRLAIDMRFNGEYK